MPRPQLYTRTFKLKVDEPFMLKLNMIADYEGLTLSDTMRELVEAKFVEFQKKGKK